MAKKKKKQSLIRGATRSGVTFRTSKKVHYASLKALRQHHETVFSRASSFAVSGNSFHAQSSSQSHTRAYFCKSFCGVIRTVG